MATTLLGEQRPGDGYLRSNNGMPSYEETWHYLVQSDNANENRANVILTDGLPRINVTPSPSGIGVCRGVRAQRREKQPRLWDVTVEFSSDVADSISSADPQTDPETWIPIYETKFERYQEIVTKDYSGTAIVNSVGQAFQTGMQVTRFIPVWEFFQLESALLTDEAIIARNETVNSVAFRGRAADTLLLTVLSSVVGYYYGQPRRLSRYNLKWNHRNWKHKRQDMGTAHLPLVDGKLQAYLDGGKPPNVILGPLDGSGGKVAAGDPPAILEFDMYNSLDFNLFLR